MQANHLQEDTTKIPEGSLKNLCDEFKKYNKIDSKLFDAYRVKKGLRNSDGTGVMAGLTLICNVHGYLINEGEKMPIPGELIYRGINIKDIVTGCQKENRFGFEEVIWLLLFGKLPSSEQLNGFNRILANCRELPDNFTEDMIIKAPSKNIMNKLARSVLALYSYDSNPEDTSLENVLRQSIELIARMSTIMVNAFHVKRGHFDHASMYFHPIDKSLSIAENILATIRADKQFTDEEAKLLDLCLMLHAEHGGGNNSTFACRVLTSSGTDTYSAISAAVGSLKGPKHGGANIKVMEMLGFIKENVKDYNDDEEIELFLEKLIKKQEGDQSGLIYGMGHAIYMISDPRSIILKENAQSLAAKKGLSDDFKILDAVERLTPLAFEKTKGIKKNICANVDLYSGLVYTMLELPPELHTPLFAVARTAGWCAHRIEELTTSSKIMRPAYKAVAELQPYVPMSER
jgi:citrate synthase